MKATFDVKMNTRIMYDFLMKHTYSTLTGWLSHLIGVVLLVLYFATFGEADATKSTAYLVFGLWCLFYMPVSLYSQSARQVRLNPVYKKPLTYTVDTNGIMTVQGDQQAFVTWDKVIKVRETKRNLLIYTGKKFCFIFAKEAMGENQSIVKTLIRENVEPGKVKINGN